MRTNLFICPPLSVNNRLARHLSRHNSYSLLVDRWRRSAGFALVLVLGTVLAVLAIEKVRTVSTAPEPRILPDMTMSPPADLVIAEREGGGYVLRFTSVMNNLGQGDLMLVGDRDDSDSEWALGQVFDEADSQRRNMTAQLVWGGDGHDHWHLVGAARYRLEPIDGSGTSNSRGDEKVGFCIFDGQLAEPELPRASATATYEEPGCGREEAVEITMGLGVGWSDPYPSELPGQLIDITGLPDGRYRLSASVDPNRLLTESDTSNNSAWTDFDLTSREPGTPRLTVVDTGTATGSE